MHVQGNLINIAVEFCCCFTVLSENIVDAAVLLPKAVWKYITTKDGEQYVMMAGVSCGSSLPSQVYRNLVLVPARMRESKAAENG